MTDRRGLNEKAGYVLLSSGTGGWAPPPDFQAPLSPETGTDGYLGTYPCTHVDYLCIRVSTHISLPIEGSLPPLIASPWHLDRTRLEPFGHLDSGALGPLGMADSAFEAISRPDIKLKRHGVVKLGTEPCKDPGKGGRRAGIIL